MSNDQPRAHPDYLIEPAELADLLNNPAATANLRLFDATVEFSQQPDGVLAAAPGEASWRQAHIPGAAFFDHMGQFAEHGSPLRNTLLEFRTDATQPLVEHAYAWSQYVRQEYQCNIVWDPQVR